jgi:hypothetical protein
MLEMQQCSSWTAKTGERGKNSQGSWMMDGSIPRVPLGIHFAHLPLTSPKALTSSKQVKTKEGAKKAKKKEQKQDTDDKKSNETVLSGPVHPRMRLMRLLRPLGLV